MSFIRLRVRTSTLILTLFGAVLCIAILSVFMMPQGLLRSRICALPLQRFELSDICSSIHRDSDSSESSVGLNFTGDNSESQEGHQENSTANAFSIHVVSLARRIDRRLTMEQLRKALRLEWQYFDALDKHDVLVDTILHYVAKQRRKGNETFEWPMDEQLRGSPELLGTPLQKNAPNINLTTEPLLCATGDNAVPSYANITSIPFHMILSRGMIACWYSHVRLMATIVKQTQDIREDSWDGREGVAIIFEDDIDAEWDLKDRLEKMMNDLPRKWDIVFLGHCWSDESFNPPVAPGSPLHPSRSPKCTHGYVLSPFGARRLLSYLTYPPFAFSRALDQALAHLVQTRRIRSFSIVPSIVIQRRLCVTDVTGECSFVLGDSDIWLSEGQRGSRWRDNLEDSTFARITKV